MNEVKLNLGCGNLKFEGWTNCDISSEVNPDIVMDIRNKFPMRSDSVSEVRLYHVLEHLTVKELEHVFKEVYRICKNDAKIEIRVPYFSHESAFSTLTHIKFFTWTSFDTLDSQNPRHYDTPYCNFEIVEKKLIWRKQLKVFEVIFNIFPRFYQEFFCWIIPAKELRVYLIANK